MNGSKVHPSSGSKAHVIQRKHIVLVELRPESVASSLEICKRRVSGSQRLEERLPAGDDPGSP